ncbi:hypothetical protein AYO20_09952 [Fonsecaea nubica]|uniref:Uncharacterized protein n=1 Tax=Fonsecaea nubica TaxID=856822 RepID=A0A178CA18_9EURO|nr:hypothetical protein AYO20_09952 [Fonsecaea nubica]OAL26810.1 hypothetical protein AYO20_09952 [Fonsecaea nubica]
MEQPTQIWVLGLGITLILLAYLYYIAIVSVVHVEPYPRQLDGASTSHVLALRAMKRLYHRLHHPEEFAHVRPLARQCLDSLLAQTNRLAGQHWDQNRSHKANSSIYCLREFSRKDLQSFLEATNTEIQDEWERYIHARKAGHPRELFQTADEAARWIERISPVKLVDGAWLGHLRLNHMPFSLHSVLKDLWQILSEELGDGDLAKNHVHVFKELLRSVNSKLSDADHEDFISSKHSTDDLSIWNSALAQLTVSLFPEDYIPEILGFNLHFELVTLETLKATKELKEVGLDPSYFLLHVCIDNTDSGHSAIAFRAVCNFMEHIRETEGLAAAGRYWERIQNGFCLSQFSTKLDVPIDTFSPNDREVGIVSLLTGKVRASRKVHCNSPARIKGQLIGKWLDPEKWDSPNWRVEFLEAFTHAEQWICPGDSSHSGFIQLISPGGKMFGSFTLDEREVLKEWIDKLSPDDVAKRQSVRNEPEWLCSQRRHPEIDVALSEKTCLNDSIVFERVIPLWFAACCLLEGFVAIPIKAAAQLSLSVLKVLRVQKGFYDGLGHDISSTNAAAEREASHDLVTIGLTMVRPAGFSPVSSIGEVLEMWPLEFSSKMLELSTRPEENKAILIGMAMAFAEFHAQLSSSGHLNRGCSEALRMIVEGEMHHLGSCWQLLAEEEGCKYQLEAGYDMARTEIRRGFK